VSEVHLLDVGVISIHVHQGRSRRAVFHRAQEVARERTFFNGISINSIGGWLSAAACSKAATSDAKMQMPE
jgi:hypothetical protein